MFDHRLGTKIILRRNVVLIDWLRWLRSNTRGFQRSRDKWIALGLGGGTLKYSLYQRQVNYRGLCFVSQQLKASMQ